MEQEILKNSKGATYMSFILDIEIVVKKEGVRANVAESKAKSKVPKKEDAKDTYSSPKKQGVQVYAMSTEPKNIFDLSMGPQQQDQDTRLQTHKTHEDSNIEYTTTSRKPAGKRTDSLASKTGSMRTRSNSVRKTDDSDSTELSKHGEDRSVLGDGVSSEQEAIPPKKKKITKAEKKAKVFKGKVEGIDFLECNRIFLCNFLNIKNGQNSKLGSSSANTLDASRLPKSKSTEAILHSKSLPNSKSQTKIQRPRKLFTLFSTKSITANFEKKQALSGIKNTVTQLEEGTINNLNQNNTKIYNKFQSIFHKKPTLLKGFKSCKSLTANGKMEKENYEKQKSLQNSCSGECSTIENQTLFELKDEFYNYDTSADTNFEKTCKGMEHHEENLHIEENDKNEYNNETSPVKGLTDLHIMFFNETESKEAQVFRSCGNTETEPVFDNKDQSLKNESSLLYELDISGTNNSYCELNNCIKNENRSDNQRLSSLLKEVSNTDITFLSNNKTQYKEDNIDSISERKSLNEMRKSESVMQEEKKSLEQIQNISSLSEMQIYNATRHEGLEDDFCDQSKETRTNKILSNIKINKRLTPKSFIWKKIQKSLSFTRHFYK